MAETFQGFLFDLDGCLYAGDHPISGARELIEYLKKKGKKVLYLTNNSSFPVATLKDHLQRMGIEARESEIISPVAYAGEFILERFGPSAVYFIGPTETQAYIEAFGHRVVCGLREDCEVVLLSCDTTLTYEKLDRGINLLRSGVPLVITNGDRTRPGDDGQLRLETGAILESMRAAVPCVKPILIGKPSSYLFEKALRSLRLPAGETLMVGDTPETDVAGGHAAGMKTALLNPEGRYGKEETGADFVFAGLPEMLDWLRQSLED